MMSYRFSVAVLAVVLVLLSCIQGRSTADEPCEKFLEALKQAGYFDVALDYLEDMKTNDLANGNFQERIPLAKVDILIDLASSVRDPQRITAYLDDAETELQAFIDSSPSTTLLADAQQQKSRLFLGRARRLIQRSSSDRLTVDERNNLRTQARDYLDRASQAFDDIRTRLAEEIENFKIDPSDQTNSKRELEVLRDRYVRVRLMSPTIKEQVADSYGAEDPKYKELLKEAVTENIDLYQKYRNRIGGIDGCINAARCYVKLEDYDKAMGYLVDVFSMPRGAAQAIKKRQAAIVAVDCWSNMNPMPFDEVLGYLQPIVYSLPPDFVRSEDGIRMRLTFAKACQLKAQKIKDDGPADREERNRLILLQKEANDHLRAISRISGPYQNEAKTLLAEMGKVVSETSEAETGPPTTMADARQRGKDLQYDVADLKIQLTQKRDALLQTTDAAQESQLQNEIGTLWTDVVQKSNQALEYFDTALALAPDDVDTDDITNLRYLQCASYFQLERFMETTIIGEFLIDRYLNNSGTKQAAELVCKAYFQLYSTDQSDDKSFELSKLKQHSDLILDKWSDSTQAESAALLMTIASLAEKKLAEADAYLAKLPSESPNRAKVVLEVGHRLWQQYVREDRKTEDRMPDDELLALRSQARKLLEDGVSYLKIETLSAYEARTVLSLTELYLDAGETSLALDLLESAPIAPLDLVKQKHAAAEEGTFRRDTYRTAIRTYLAMLKETSDPMQWVEKAQGVLTALKSEIGDTPEGKKTLSAIYLTLSKELKQQFDSLTTNEQRLDFAQGLKTFLTALQSNAADNELLALTASLFTQVGQGLATNDMKTESRQFYSSAVEIYNGLLAKNLNMEKAMQLSIQRGLANALSGTGEFERSVKQFGDILANPDNRKYVDIQVDASLALQNWGLEKNLADPLAKAILGGEKRQNPTTRRDENVIWGWSKLAKAARGARRDELFAQSVYNMCICRFEYGKIKKDPKMQQSALKELENYRANVPEMGGSNWKPKFEALENRIRREVN